MDAAPGFFNFNSMQDYFKIVVAMLIWSTWGLMIRWIALPPVVVLFYTALIAGIAVPLVLKVRGEFGLAGVAAVWPLFAMLAVGSIINNITYFYALANTTVSNAVFTHYTAPLFVALLAPLFIAEKLQKVTIIALPLAAAGMVLIVLSGGGLRWGGEHSAGIIAGTVSGVAYAVLVIVSRKLSRMMLHYKSVVLLLWITAAATAPVALSTAHVMTLQAGLLLLVGGLAHSTVAPLLYFSALRKVLAQHAAVLGYIEPLAAVPFAMVFLGEVPSSLSLIGGILIVVSGYIIIHAAAHNGNSA